MLPLDLARRCIPLLRVPELAGRNHTFLVKSMGATSHRNSIEEMFLHSWFLDKNEIEKPTEKRKKERNALV